LDQSLPELKDKRLLIVSDGVLQYIPFAGLPDPQLRQRASLSIMKW
jgi:hypothetical protein